MDILTTVLIGVGTVFVGLVCLVLIIELMHAIVSAAEKKKAPATPLSPPPDNTPALDHNTLVVCAAAAIAEELGTTVDAIRITSIKKL